MQGCMPGHAARALRLVFLSLCLAPALSVRATEVVEWRNVPIPIVLHVGEERVLVFPDHVQVGLPTALTRGEFRTQSTGGTVLWLANAPIQNERVQVKLINTGHVMLFDVTAVAVPGAGPSEAVHVVFPEMASESDASGAARTALTPVALTRFAAQQFYAPQRLLRDVPGLRRVPMGTRRSVSLYRGDQIEAEPLASWQGGGYYVTAVKLSNRGAARIFLDPRRLRGQFVTAAFQHHSLGAAHSRTDVTTVYLVTDLPFVAALSLFEPEPSAGEVN